MADGPAVRRAAAAQVLVGDADDPLLSETDRHHLLRVLRLGPDERFVVTDGRGRWRLCRFTRRGPEGAVTFAGPVESEAAPRPAVTVAFAPVKAERPDSTVQRLTEMGVDRIVLVSTARSVVRWDGARTAALLARLSKVAVAASCQCRRVWLPEIAGPVPLADLVSQTGAPSLALAEPGAGPLGAAVTALAVGPEGGWDPAELALGCPTVGLGPAVLRAETAALVAGALVCAVRAGTVGPGSGAGADATSGGSIVDG